MKLAFVICWFNPLPHNAAFWHTRYIAVENIVRKGVSWFALFPVFKIYNIDEDGFEEKHNLRVGKNINLNYCVRDIAWNHTEGILSTLLGFFFFFCLLSWLLVAHLTDAPGRRIVVTGKSSRIQDETTENSTWFFNVQGVWHRHTGPLFNVSYERL